MAASGIAHGACEPIPPSWKLHAPVDRSSLHPREHPVKGDWYDDAVAKISEALRPGEKLTPYSDWVTHNGYAGGTSGMALIRGKCLVGSVMMMAI